MKIHSTLLFFSVLMFLFPNVLQAGEPNLTNSEYIINRGERPPVDYSKLTKDDYEAGKFYIKIIPGLEEKIPDVLTKAQNNQFVITGVESLDAL